MVLVPVIILNVVTIPLFIALVVAYFISARKLTNKVQTVEENTMAIMDSILAMSIPMQLTKEINACALEHARNLK
ncbi:unnamed protein product [Cylicocyclus nassatus]|uniref:Uncharacterized protein n=1 Tax=Cylicocyclus nassatus TaxID=53992 RepID=A0AA36DN08_CYLNA|nr:unnamed protein product [Cylicocyclus nassatus]CAJ0589559.1 unnamed protein product [Cylicocyclus nassatus]